jgi:hypothetical protein
VAMLVKASVLPACGPTLVNRTEVNGLTVAPAADDRVVQRSVLDVHPVST